MLSAQQLSLLCATRPLVVLLKHWYEKNHKHFHLLCHCPSLCIAILCRNPKPIHSRFLYQRLLLIHPASCFTAIFSFFFCLTAFHHPSLPPSRSFSTLCLYLFFFSRFPLLGVFAHNHSALITLMALMIHLNGALSPSVSPRPFSCSPFRQKYFLRGHHDCVAPATGSCDSVSLYTGQSEISTLTCSLFNPDSWE